MCGIGNTGLSKAAEAFEKLFKLFLMLEAKIMQNRELVPKDLKKYNHKLGILFTDVKLKSGARFEKEWDDYFQMLQDTYGRRYPEHWKVHKIQVSLYHLDNAYTYFRNAIILNFPEEERTRAKDFGTFLYDAYDTRVNKWIERQGGKTPSQILRLNNQCFGELNVNKEKL